MIESGGASERDKREDRRGKQVIGRSSRLSNANY